jgi:type VI secretion system protein VasI
MYRLLQLVWLIAWAVLMLPIWPVMADDKDLAACTEIENSIERLACFDTAAKARGVVSPEVASPVIDSGVWSVRTETSKVDDSSNVFVMVESNEPIAGRLDQPELARLIVRCMENQTDVLVWMAGLWYTDSRNATTRIDKQKARTQRWIEGHSKEWMFHPDPISFVRAMMDGQELYFVTEPINEGPREMTFPIAGLTSAIKPLQEACHWK